MLPKEERLTENRDFQKVYSRGYAVRGRFTVLHYLRRRSAERRFGIVASKKLGKAHDRNRVKRRLREAVRQQQQCFKTGYDFVFVARKAAAEPPFQTLLTEIRSLASKAGLWQEPEHPGCGTS